MSTSLDHILSVSNTRNSEDAAVQLDHVNENHIVLVLRRLFFNENLCSALSRTLQRKCRANKTFKRVELRNINGEIEDAISFCMISNAVQALYLLINNMTLDGTTWFTIGKNLCTSTLRCLMVTTDLNALGMKSLSYGLESTMHLKTLEFNGCYFDDDETVSSLAIGLLENTSLESVGFRSCSIQDARLARLVTALRDHPSLGVLDLNNNKAGPLTSRAIVQLLASSSCRLEKLDMSCQTNRYDKIDISMISTVLKKSQHLTTLDLSDCKLDDIDVASLCTVFVANTTLTTVFLERNQISNCGITNLANQLPKMDTLKRLELHENLFSEEGSRAFATGLKRNFSLEKVTLFPNFKSADLIAFYSLLNYSGRRLMRSTNFPLSMWPRVLARINTAPFPMHSNVSHQDLLFFMLQGPAFVHAHT